MTMSRWKLATVTASAALVLAGCSTVDESDEAAETTVSEVAETTAEETTAEETTESETTENETTEAETTEDETTDSESTDAETTDEETTGDADGAASEPVEVNAVIEDTDMGLTYTVDQVIPAFDGTKFGTMDQIVLIHLTAESDGSTTGGLSALAVKVDLAEEMDGAWVSSYQVPAEEMEEAGLRPYESGAPTSTSTSGWLAYGVSNAGGEVELDNLVLVRERGEKTVNGETVPAFSESVPLSE